ncbi:MAG: 3'(2'),5'-bisphosphate nucleotidase CysQ [Chitinophagales bacterium]|nr:MAG: 3'(2'),5'-bisphosphate nucleotidase CysQ [Chitinophagales bacterium]
MISLTGSKVSLPVLKECTMSDLPVPIEPVIQIASEAGEAIMEIYRQDFEVFSKADSSPITLADKRSNDIITHGLKELSPAIPVISEESRQTPYAIRKTWDWVWIVDPLDGTKEFVSKNGEFTVNIGLVYRGKPVAGVVLIPLTGVCYYAFGESSFKRVPGEKAIRLNRQLRHYTQKTKLKVVASRSHLTEEVKQFVRTLQDEGKEVELVTSGSSVKFCIVAEGEADVYPRFGPTMEWDTAAAHAIATAAGRKVIRADNRQPLVYNKESMLNPWFIVE